MNVFFKWLHINRISSILRHTHTLVTYRLSGSTLRSRPNDHRDGQKQKELHSHSPGKTYNTECKVCQWNWRKAFNLLVFTSTKASNHGLRRHGFLESSEWSPRLKQMCCCKWAAGEGRIKESWKFKTRSRPNQNIIKTREDPAWVEGRPRPLRGVTGGHAQQSEPLWVRNVDSQRKSSAHSCFQEDWQ